MKKLYSLLFLAVTSAAFAQQAPPFYEGFNYADGATLQTQPGWTLLNSGDDLLVAAGSLTYTGLPASTGNKVTFSGAGIDSYKEFASQTANTVYYSILLNVTDLTATTSTTGGYCLGFTQSASTSLFGATMWLKKVDATTYNIGINPRTTVANTVFAPTAYNVNQTYLVVVSYTSNASTGDDVVNMWINPSSLGGTQPAATLTATNTGGTDLASVGRFLIRQGSATDTPDLQIDELRIANNWVDATSTTAALRTNQNSITGLNIYPNPVVNGTLFIETSANAEKTVAIFDVLGKQVVRTTTDSNAINVANLNAGIYIVKVTEEGKTATRKLVIK